ncbi:MAG: response regulator transcription factor [Ktedonobacteraceae bacterium]
MTQKIRILIVDDQTLVREGFRKLLELEADLEVLDTASDGKAALVAAERLAAAGTPPDVILMDIRMPGMDGIATTRELKARWPDTRIVILTTFDDDELIHAGLRAGALGYLLKDTTAEQLALTIRLAARGQVLLQPDIASKIFSSFATSLPPSLETTSQTSSSPASNAPVSPINGLVEPLTEREREILSLVASGSSNRQIAESLYLTEGTVKNHMSSILGKLGVRDRTQAALKAKELGLA